MVRQIGKLSAFTVSRAKEPRYYGDGGGLWLQVTKAGAKSWVFRFTLRDRSREMGLGPLHTVSLADARDAALQCRRLLREGIDPIEDRRDKRAAALLDAARAMTFNSCAEAYIEAHEAGWRSAKHAGQWRATLKTYAGPVLGELAVQSIDVGLVMKVLEPIWVEKTETASRLRGRIEGVLDWATVRGYRRGENPARWRGHLDSLLPSRAKVRRVKHHAALPYAEIGAFMRELRTQNGFAATALEFAILTATRTSETIGATWDEIDLAAGVWTIPATRIKAGSEHRVPLSVPALDILKRMNKTRLGDNVFPGGKHGKPLSNMALLKVKERMGRADLTVHGFRSTFRDWAAEQTNFPREVAEKSLAHAIGDRVEAAYRRGDLFQKRKRLMDEWSRFCDSPAARRASNMTRLRGSETRRQLAR